MDFNFHMPVHVVSGEGAVARNSTLLRTLGRRCLIITGGSSAKRSGALADVTAALDLWEIGWAVYDAVGPNPLVSACHEAGGSRAQRPRGVYHWHRGRFAARRGQGSRHFCCQ